MTERRGAAASLKLPATLPLPLMDTKAEVKRSRFSGPLLTRRRHGQGQQLRSFCVNRLSFQAGTGQYNNRSIRLTDLTALN